MTADAAPRRYLLTGVVSEYRNSPDLDRPGLVQVERRIARLFAGFGYKHLDDVIGRNPTRDRLRDALSAFARGDDRRPSDYVVVYLSGHGDILEGGPTGSPHHVLLAADYRPDQPRARSVKSAELAEWLLAETRVHRLLLIVDACLSGQGALNFAAKADEYQRDPTGIDPSQDYGLAVLTATRPHQPAYVGEFATNFELALAEVTPSDGTLPIDPVVRALGSRMPPSRQPTARTFVTYGRGGLPDFFPSQLRVEAADRRTWATHRRRRETELASRFALDVGEFVGRTAARGAIVRWLDDRADRRSVIVVGAPGSGKTALLGRLALASDPTREPMVPRDGGPDAAPRSIDVAIHAAGLPGTEILGGIASAAEIPNLDPELDPESAVAALVAGLGERDRSLTVLIDGLDEALQPEGLVRSVLRPLIEESGGRIRLLLGARPRIRGYFVDGGLLEIDLDGRYADEESLHGLTHSRLAVWRDQDGTKRPSVLAAASRELRTAVAEGIVAVAKPSFFLARLLADHQAAAAGVPDPYDPTWLAGLADDAGAAMRRDMERRLGDGADRAMALLLPLAYAHGNGLPWEGVWPALATALTPAYDYDPNEDLRLLRDHAGSYVVETPQPDGNRYRLCHQSLADSLRNDRDGRADEKTIVDTLIERVRRRPDGRPDWAGAHPYVRTYLAGHAVRAGEVDQLAQDPGFLLAADPPLLLAALDGTTSPRAGVAANAYRRALPALRSHPEHRAAYLGLAARCARAHHLADEVVDAEPWRALWASWRIQPPHVRIRHDQPVNAVATASIDGRVAVLSGGDDGALRLWDARTGSPVHDPIDAHGDEPVRAIAVGRLDGRPVAVTGGDDGAVRVWDLHNGTAVGAAFTGHDRPVLSVAVAALHDGQVVISAGADATVRVSDLATGDPLGPAFEGHTGAVHAVACGVVDRKPVVVSGGADTTVRIWDLDTNHQHVDLPDARVVRTVAVAELHDRQVVLYGSDHRWVRVHDLASGAVAGPALTGATSGVLALATTVLEGRPVVAWAGDAGSIHLSDPATGEQVGELLGHDGAVRCLAAARVDGRPVVISGGADGTVRIWDVGGPASATDPFTGHHRAVRSIALTGIDGDPVVVTAGTDGTVRLWDLATGSPIRGPYTGHGNAVSVAIPVTIGDRTVVASAGADGAIHVWDLVTGDPVGPPYRGHRTWVNALAVGQLDGRTVIVSGGADATVQIWDLADRTTPRPAYTRHRGGVRAVAVTRLDGRQVVLSASEDRTVHVWDLDTGAPARPPFEGHASRVMALAVGEPDDRPVAISGDVAGTVRIWDPAAADPSGVPLHIHAKTVRALATARLPAGTVGISGSEDRTARVWAMTGTVRQEDARTVEHADWVRSLLVTRMGGAPAVVSGGGDGTVRIWDVATGVDHFARHDHWVRALAVGRLGRRRVVVSGSVDATVRVWDLDDGRPVGRPLVGHRLGVRAVAVLPVPGGQSVVVSGSDDGTLRVWDPAGSGPPREPMTGHSDWVRALAVGGLPGSGQVVVSGGDTTVRLWDVHTGREVADPYPGHRSRVRAVAVAALGGRPVVVSAGDDAAVHVWDPTGGRRTGVFGRHSAPIRSLAVTDAGGRPVVISASDDATVLAWDLETRELVAEPFTSHTAEVGAVAAAPGGGRSRHGVRTAVSAGDRVTILRLTPPSRSWGVETVIDVGSDVLAAVLPDPARLVIAAKLGLVAVALPAGTARRPGDGTAPE